MVNQTVLSHRLSHSCRFSPFLSIDTRKKSRRKRPRSISIIRTSLKEGQVYYIVYFKLNNVGIGKNFKNNNSVNIR